MLRGGRERDGDGMDHWRGEGRGESIDAEE